MGNPSDIAGLIVPWVQEALLGARLSGRSAALVSALLALIVAAGATWATGGFADARGAPAFNLADPSAFLGFWWGRFAPVFALAKLEHATLTGRDAAGNAFGPIIAAAAPVQRVLGTGPG